MPMRVVPILLLATALLLAAACASPEDEFPVIPPCTPVVGSAIDPCRVGDHEHKWPGLMVDILVPPEPPTMRQHLDGNGRWDVIHIVVRATILPDSIRCAPNVFHSTPMGAFQLFDGSNLIHCYVDVRANEYIVGTGPSQLPVRYVTHFGPPTVSIVNDVARVLSEGGKGETIEAPHGGIGGREWVFFLRPNFDIAVEVWEIGLKWDVQELRDGSVVAAQAGATSHDVGQIQFETPNRAANEAAKVRSLDVFVEEVKAAHAERLRAYDGRIGVDENAPQLVGDVRRLSDYFKAIGAYDHLEGQPAQPPPAGGLPATDSSN